MKNENSSQLSILNSQFLTLNSPLIPRGYKQTEVGVIPEDWEVKSLGKFLALQRGHDLTERDRRPGDIPVMGSAGPNGFHDTALAKSPGVVLGRSGASFGQAHYCVNDFWPHNTALYVTDFFGNNRLFAFYLLKSINFSRHNSGGAQQSLNRNFIAPVPVGVPPIHEQEAIAEALSDADALIESLEQLIAKKRHLKQGAMQELLTGKRRLSVFANKTISYKQTEVGVIPEDWEVLSLEGITKNGGLVRGPFGGALKKEFFVKQGYKVYEQRNAIYRTTEQGDYYIDDQKFKELSRFRVQPGDLIVSCSGTIGCIYQIPVGVPDGVINQALLKITLNDDLVDGDFFLSVFRWEPFQTRITENSHGGAMQNLVGMEVFKKTSFQLPTKAEQEAIAGILSDMDAEIAALEAKLAKARQLKQGMMQELLTGKIRLV